MLLLLLAALLILLLLLLLLGKSLCGTLLWWLREVLGVCHAWRPPHRVTEAALQAVKRSRCSQRTTRRRCEGQRHSFLH
jgi:hypothetical protein